MNRTQRRLFMWFFIFLFALVAPTVILFAQGYRFNLENSIFIHSGAITIKSNPSDIDIFIDGKKQENKNLNIVNGSYTINGVKPGKYHLVCSKEGYSSWEKDIEVHSGVSTEFWNVLLFPKEQEKKVISLKETGEAQQFFLSPNKNELVLFSKNNEKIQIHLLKTKNNEFELIFENEEFNFIPKEEGLNVEWNTSDEKIILPVLNKEGLKKYLVAEVGLEKKNTFINLNDFFVGENIYQARWMFDEENAIILLTEKNNLFYFNLEKETAILIAENVSGFDLAEYEIYFSQLPNNIIWKVKQSDLKNKKQVTNEPLILENERLFIKITAYDKYRIFVNAIEKSFLHNEDDKKNLVSILKSTEKVTGVQFSNDGKKLLCWNNHEVWYYMLRDWETQPKRYFGDKITITRSAEPIKNVQWMDNYENIVLSTEYSVRSFEVDPRNYTNISDLIKTDNKIEDKNLIYNKDNQTLYFLNKNELISLLIINSSGFLGF